MTGDQDSRIWERASLALRHSRHGRIVLLSAVALIVLVNTFIDAVAGYYLIMEDFHPFSAWSAISMGFTAIINVILVVLMWIVFETLARVEQESLRTQTFMDHMYRRLP